jgi:hypothetical protein
MEFIISLYSLLIRIEICTIQIKRLDDNFLRRGRKRVDRGAEMIQKHKLASDIFQSKDCVLIAQGKYANSKTRVNNSSVKAS